MSREHPKSTQTTELEQRALASLRSLESVQAPASLRRSIEESTREASSRRRTRIAPRLRRAGAGALTAAVAVTIALLLSAGTSPHPPSVLDASRLALRPATLPSPAESSRDREVLERSVEGVSYPYWGGRGGWRTAGARVDELGGQRITTVFYAARNGGRIGYAIVAGRPLPVPAGATSVERGGVRFGVLGAAGATVVTWRESDHTCILVARNVPAHTLLRLVS